MKARKLNGEIMIGVFSPSSPIFATIPICYERGIQYLQAKGYKGVNG